MDASTNKWACITGATSGIGEAFAKEFAKQGYHLILTGRNGEKLSFFSEELKQENKIMTEVETGDFGDWNAVQDLAAKLSKRKELRILVNNAGFGVHSPFEQEDFLRYKDMLYVHELALMRLTHAVLPLMIGAEEGTIINVSSTAAFTPHPLNAVYAATKSMVKSFSESIFLELEGTGVYVQALCPGVTRTEFHERMGLNQRRLYSKKGIMKAMDPEDVVRISLKCMRKNKPVCVPGFNNKIIRLALKFLPNSLVYKIVKQRQMPSGRP